MSELVPFWKIEDSLDEVDEDRWTPEQLEAARFFSHLDYEGGVIGLLDYSIDAFPAELRPLAIQARAALETLDTALVEWGRERGVEW